MGKRKGLASELAHYPVVGLDSSVLIYHLEGIAPYADLTEVTFSLLARGKLSAVISTLSVTELLTKPFAESDERAIAVCEQFLQGLPHTKLVAPTYAIARQAASLRGRYGLRTPDALLLSTALSEGAKAFLTNDARLKQVAEEIAVLLLNDYV